MSEAAETRKLPDEPDKVVAIDAEYLSGRRFPYQEDISLLDDVDLVAATPGEDINWLEDVTLLEEEGVPAVFDRYSNSFIKIYFQIPDERRDDQEPRHPGEPRLGDQRRDLGAGGARLVGLVDDHDLRAVAHRAEDRLLVWDRAQGAPRQVSAAGARPVGRGLADGRGRLSAIAARRLGSARSLMDAPGSVPKSPRRASAHRTGPRIAPSRR